VTFNAYDKAWHVALAFMVGGVFGFLIGVAWGMCK
jgi:hypothetical protein